MNDQKYHLIDAVLVRDYGLVRKNIKAYKEHEDLFKENQLLAKILQHKDKPLVYFEIVSLQHPKIVLFSSKNDSLKIKLDFCTNSGPLFFRFKKNILK